jgi:hypothetical protein
MGKLIIIITGIVFVTGAIAEPVKRIDSQSFSSAKIPAESALVASPSRLIGPETLKEYTDVISSKFQVTTQDIDPFCNSQDLTVTREVSSAPEDKVVKPNRVSLSEIVRRLKIGMILHTEKKIVVNKHSFTQGEAIPVMFNGQQVSLSLTAMTEQQLTFKNIATGETATRELNQMPAGMTVGKQQTTPLGMTPNSSNTLIDLGADNVAP